MSHQTSFRLLSAFQSSVCRRTLLRYLRLMTWALRLSSVTSLHPTQRLEPFGNIFLFLGRDTGSFTFIFAVSLHFCSCYVARCTWYAVRSDHNLCGDPVAQRAPTKFGTKVVIVTYSPNPSCVPNLKLLASTAAEISRGSQLVLNAFLVQTPVVFDPKSCFWWATSQT